MVIFQRRVNSASAVTFLLVSGKWGEDAENWFTIYNTDGVCKFIKKNSAIGINVINKCCKVFTEI